VVEGRVQGVGFRYWVVGVARELELAGYVRNLADGTVEVEAAGTSSALERLGRKLMDGPPAARVTKVRGAATAGEPSGPFEIAY
jgi:acylphosphatase